MASSGVSATEACFVPAREDQLAVGQAVQVLFRVEDGEKWYRGVVEARLGCGWMVTFEDGAQDVIADGDKDFRMINDSTEEAGSKRGRETTGFRGAASRRPRKRLSASAILNGKALDVASWVGKPIGLERGKHLYAAFSKNGETVRLGECVFVRAGPNEKDTLLLMMRVRKMWQEPGRSDPDAMQIQGQWLYRPSQTVAGAGAGLHPREILLSDWEDRNPVECVICRCNVSFLSGPPADPELPLGRLAAEGARSEVHYVCWRGYSVSRGAILALHSLRPARWAGSSTSGGAADAHAANGDGGGDGGGGRERAAARLEQNEELEWTGAIEVARLRRADGPAARAARARVGHLILDAMPEMPACHVARILAAHDAEALALSLCGELAGAAVFRHHPRGGFLELELLGVPHALHRRGLASLLLRRVAQLARREGHRWLLTAADETAVSFFLAVGFSNKLTIPRKAYSGVVTPYSRAHLMELPLSGSDGAAALLPPRAASEPGGFVFAPCAPALAARFATAAAAVEATAAGGGGAAAGARAARETHEGGTPNL